MKINTAESQMTKTLGKVLYSRGDAFVNHKNKNKRLKKDLILHYGDVIKTGSKSLVVISFGSQYKSKIKIIQNSELKITENTFLIGPNKKLKTNVIISSGGVVINFVNKKLKEMNENDMKLSVVMKSVSLGVRGTVFFAYENHNSSYLAVDHGEVVMKSHKSKNSVNVKKSTSSLLNKNGGVIKPREMKWQKSVNWKFSGQMEQSDSLFLVMKKSYNAYKDEQEYIFKKYKDNNKKQLNNWRKESDSMRNRMFGN